MNLGEPLYYSLKGRRRLRVGNYRVVYRVNQSERTVIVTEIGHIYQLCFLKIFYLCNFATLPSHMGNKNPLVIEIDFISNSYHSNFYLSQ
ncbi:MAG: type II toxin-antitoxin system RelE family toxin [Wolbachia sp.]